MKNILQLYITIFFRYVDVILNLIRIAGDYVSEEVWYRVIQIVINRDEVQGYAAKTVFEVSFKKYNKAQNTLYTISFYRRYKLQHATKTWSKSEVISWASSAIW